MNIPVSIPNQKFRDPFVTAKGEKRASVALDRLSTLWFNTGTHCNLACTNCYIESSPKNDRLEYLTRAEARAFLDEIARDLWPVQEIGFTGGEPFMNPDIVGMIEDALARGHRVLVLTNAMRPMMKLAPQLSKLRARHGERFSVRVSVDHYGQMLHEKERGANSWAPTIAGLLWLAREGFAPAIASRLMWGESDADTRAGFRGLLAELGIALDVDDPTQLVLFPEMDVRADVPEITEACWGILHKSPDAMMCASSRMVVKHKGAVAPSVISCTLLPYDDAFDMGATLKDAAGPVQLNHPHCAKFCVLGGAACSRA